MPHGGLGIYPLDTTGIDGVGMGALEMQILAALETSGGPLLGQTGAAWTMEKTEPYDAPPGSERCSPNPMWGFPRRFLTGFSRLFPGSQSCGFHSVPMSGSCCLPVRPGDKCTSLLRAQMAWDLQCRVHQGSPGDAQPGDSPRSHVQRRGRQAGARPLEKDPAIRSEGNSDVGPRRPTEPAGGWLPRFPMQWARCPLPPFRKGPGGTARSFLLQDRCSFSRAGVTGRGLRKLPQGNSFSHSLSRR